MLAAKSDVAIKGITMLRSLVISVTMTAAVSGDCTTPEK